MFVLQFKSHYRFIENPDEVTSIEKLRKKFQDDFSLSTQDFRILFKSSKGPLLLASTSQLEYLKEYNRDANKESVILEADIEFQVPVEDSPSKENGCSNGDRLTFFGDHIAKGIDKIAHDFHLVADNIKTDINPLLMQVKSRFDSAIENLKEPFSSNVHPNVICDICNRVIKGVRYRCYNCKDFDFCGYCRQYHRDLHPKSHLFIEITNPKYAEMLSKTATKNVEELSTFSLEKSEMPTSIYPDSVHKNDSNVEFDVGNMDGQIAEDIPLLIKLSEGDLRLYEKTWKIKNMGSIDWDIGTVLVCVLAPWGFKKNEDTQLVVSPTKVDEEVTLSISLKVEVFVL